MATKVLAPARPATLAAQVLTSVRHATTAYLFFRKTSHERGAPRRCTFFSKTSHERGALRRRTFFFRRPRTSGARYDGATFFLLRPSQHRGRQRARRTVTDDPASACARLLPDCKLNYGAKRRTTLFDILFIFSSTKAIRILCCGGEPQASATAMPTNNSRLKTRRKESIVSSPRWGIILARPGPPRDVRTTTSFLNTEPYRR